jgi:hypothetical protein
MSVYRNCEWNTRRMKWCRNNEACSGRKGLQRGLCREKGNNRQVLFSFAGCQTTRTRSDIHEKHALESGTQHAASVDSGSSFSSIRAEDKLLWELEFVRGSFFFQPFLRI